MDPSLPLVAVRCERELSQRDTRYSPIYGYTCQRPLLHLIAGSAAIRFELETKFLTPRLEELF